LKHDLKNGKGKGGVIAFNVSGHGLLDTSGFAEVLGKDIGSKVRLEDLMKTFTLQPF